MAENTDRPRSTRQRERTVTVSARIPASDRELIEALAIRRRISTSELVRRLLMAGIREGLGIPPASR